MDIIKSASNIIKLIYAKRRGENVDADLVQKVCVYFDSIKGNELSSSDLHFGNFTRLFWAIRGHKFAYPGRKDTIKACIYVKELVRFLLWKTEVKSEELKCWR